MNEQSPAGADRMTVGMWPEGAAFVDGAYMPIAEASISVLDFGFTRSDATYDVLHVWGGRFFRLEDHLDRFTRSLAGLRMSVPHDREGIAAILAECVRRTGLREAYVAMVCTRGTPTGATRGRLSAFRNRFIAYALPWIDVLPKASLERGAHMIIARTPRIPEVCVDPTIKNYNRGDMNRALFEAEDAGAETAILADLNGNITEGPGFNVFAVRDGTVHTPDHGSLEGITRLTVLDLCAELGIPVQVGPITVEAFRDADEIFASTTAGGIMPVSRIDGTILANDRPGPVSARIKDVYWRKHDEGWHGTPIDYGG